MLLSIIIPVHNRLDLTQICLRTIEETIGRRDDFEVIIVDDGSKDGTPQWTAQLPKPRYRTLRQDPNRGYARANNAAAEIAHGRLLLLLNNDTELRPGWLEPMLQVHAMAPNVGIVGNIQIKHRTRTIDHAGVCFLVDGRPLHVAQGLTRIPPGEFRRWPAVTAACCLLERSLFLELGGFATDFRNGYEDVDLCLRAWQKGYRHYVAHGSVIEHHVSASPGRMAAEEANRAFFLQRWAEFLGDWARRTAPPPAEAHPEHRRAEAWRYLRKHAYRPWRYNGPRLARSLRTVLTEEEPVRPRPIDDEQAFFVRLDAPAAESPMLYIVATDTARNPVRSGIQTLVRSLLNATAHLRPTTSRAVRWDRKRHRLTLLPADHAVELGAPALNDPRPLNFVQRLQRPTTLVRADGRHLPLHRHPHHERRLAEGWLLIPELIYGEGRAAEVLSYARAHGLRIAVIIHDVIPIDHPEASPPGVPALHRDFLLGVAGADLLLATSDTVRAAVNAFFERERVPPPNVTTVRLPAEFLGSPRHLQAPPERAMRRALCVSTLEARKNHAGLLEALAVLSDGRGGLPLEIDLVGAAHDHAPEVRALVEAAVLRHAGRLRWHGQVSDEALAELYRGADFTVYPSVVEGFGMPVMESLWFARPCICADFSVMAENAAGGGCLTVDVREPAALAGAIRRLTEDSDLRARLGQEAVERRLTNWLDYAYAVVRAMEDRR
ncbi:MAG: glycosyltransferase [Verrucomicrobia bacterium]|nr:glycosyltransferase [Verrucomicrobiota bacterium]